MEEETLISGEARQVTHAATLISVGNVISRVLGMAREMVKSYFFGATGAVSAFSVAAQVPTMLYDLLTGGMLSSSLVPVFSDYARPEHRRELWKLLSLLLSLMTIFLGAFVVLIEITAPTVIRLLSGGLDPENLILATRMLRITTPAIFFLNVAGLLSALLFALQRFTRPAFLSAISNLTLIIVVAALGRTMLGPQSLAVGLLAGSIVQVLFQLDALREANLRFVSPFAGHPALRTIGQLYLPIGLGLIVDQMTVALSFNLASRTGESGIAWMKYAATIIQFPLGIVVTAISIAILPTLSRYAADEREERFRATLAQGLRLVLVLVLPTATLLLLLAEPVVALLYQRGNFMPADTQAVAMALRFNLLGLIFAALDQPLIFAFYARKDTWTPALVGVATTVLYAIMALTPTLFGPPTLALLILANSLKLMAHALFMLHLFVRKVGPLTTYRLPKTTRVSLIASLVMAGPVFGIHALLVPHVPPEAQGVLIELLVPTAVGAAIYLALIHAFKLHELDLLVTALRDRWKRADAREGKT